MTCKGCDGDAVIVCHSCHAPLCSREAAVNTDRCPACDRPWTAP